MRFLRWLDWKLLMWRSGIVIYQTRQDRKWGWTIKIGLYKAFCSALYDRWTQAEEAAYERLTALYGPQSKYHRDVPVYRREVDLPYKETA